MSLNRRPNQSPVRWMSALAAALLVGALTAPIAMQAQAPFVAPGSTCTAPPAPESDTWPKAGTDSLGSTAGAPVTFSAATLLANDTGASLTVQRVGPSSSAGGTITGSNPYTYTPAAGFVGPDIFTYEIGDAANQTTVGLITISSTPDLTAPTISDSSPSGRNGTITGAVRVPGKVGSALSFNGISDWVTVIDGAAGTPLDLTTGMTLEAWVKPTAIDGWETVILKERGVNALSYALYAHDCAPLAGGFNAPAGYVRIGTMDRAVRGVSRISTTDWTHLATTYDGVTH